MRSIDLLDAADVDEVGAEAEDHAFTSSLWGGRREVIIRASSINARMRRMEASRPTKIASPIRKWPMLSSRDLRDGGDGFDIVIGQAMAGMDLQADAMRHRPRLREFCPAGARAPRPSHWHRRRCAVPPPARPATSRRRAGAVGLDEHGDADARVAQRARRWASSRLCWPAASMPPSVVRSSRFSGTMQAACGLCLQRDGQHLVGRRHFQIERRSSARARAARYRRRRYAAGPRADAR